MIFEVPPNPNNSMILYYDNCTYFRTTSKASMSMNKAEEKDTRILQVHTDFLNKNAG